MATRTLHNLNEGDVFRRGSIFNRRYVIVRVCTMHVGREAVIVGDLASPDAAGWFEFPLHVGFPGKWIGNAYRK